jgi:hypothetical protein
MCSLDESSGDSTALKSSASRRLSQTRNDVWWNKNQSRLNTVHPIKLLHDIIVVKNLVENMYFIYLYILKNRVASRIKIRKRVGKNRAEAEVITGEKVKNKVM